MAKTIIVAGYGIGISKAVAEKFAAEGFAVALVARNAEKLAAGVKDLEAKGAKALAIKGDLGNEKSVTDVVAKARTLGPIHVLQWTAYAGQAGNVLEADTAAFHAVLDVATIGLTAAGKRPLTRNKARPFRFSVSMFTTSRDCTGNVVDASDANATVNSAPSITWEEVRTSAVPESSATTKPLP